MLHRLALLISFGSAGFLAAADAPTHPNILLIVADDLNTSLGCYGHPDVKSPNIDRLAARGVRFDRAYCQYPLCNPSRVSLLSGRRPESSGVYVLSTPARRAMPSAIMLPQYFRQQGYFSGGAGKVAHSPKVNDAASWDFYDDGDGDDAEEKAALKARYGSGDQTKPGGGGDGRPSGFRLSTDGARTRDGINSRTIARLIGEQADRGKPFFLAAGMHKPHLPWTAPREFFDLYPLNKLRVEREPAIKGVPEIALQTELSGFAQPASRAEAIQGYYACISFTDANVGRLLAELDRHSLWESTIVVLIGDNGFHLGDHGGLWSKLSAFDASTHVPFIMAGAGIPAGRVVATPVELLDIYPTLLSLAGFTPPSDLEGASLVELMRDGATAGHRPAASIVFHYDVERRVDVRGRTVVTRDWRYTEWDEGRAGREFYWLPDDPREYWNRVGDDAYRESVQAGADLIRRSPEPKLGPANRPRALLSEPQAVP